MLASAKPDAVSGAREAAPARRDGHARLGQPLPRGAARRRGLRPRTRPRRSGSPRATPWCSIHCGSRGLGHQIGTDFLRDMVVDGARLRDPAARSRARLRADRLASSGARTSARCARRSTARSRTGRSSRTSRAACSRELVPGRAPRPAVTTSRTTPARRRSTSSTARRAGCSCTARARRARSGPGHPDAAREPLRAIGQPVLIGGTMGTASYVLAGRPRGEARRGARRATARAAR